MTKMIINSGKPIPIIIHTLQVLNDRLPAGNKLSAQSHNKVKFDRIYPVYPFYISDYKGKGFKSNKNKRVYPLRRDFIAFL